MKLALHRSITFWSGILVIGFLGWAWWDSMARVSMGGVKAWEIANCNRGVLVQKERNSGSWRKWGHQRSLSPEEKGSALPGVSFERGGGRDMIADWEKLQDEHPEATKVRGGVTLIAESLGAYQGPLDRIAGPIRYRPVQVWRLFIPHWLLLLAFAAIWSGLLAWRSRRRRKAATLGLS